MNELNEKLAVEVMEWHEEHEWETFWVNSDGRVQMIRSQWNPTTDLNQLRMCYEAAEKDCSTKTMLFEFAFTDALQKEFRKENKKYTHYETATAWVKHPELVAQAILKAKGVS